MHIQNLVKLYHFVLKILSRNEILNVVLTSIKGHNSITNARKMMCSNPNLDLVNINASTQFGETISISSQHIKRKRNDDGRNDGQPKSSIAPLFQSGAIIRKQSITIM